MIYPVLHIDTEKLGDVLNTDPSGKQIPYKFFLHPLLSAEPDLNPATNGA